MPGFPVHHQLTEPARTQVHIHIYVRIFTGFPICQWLFNQLISNEIDNFYVSDWQELQSFPIHIDGKFVENVS